MVDISCALKSGFSKLDYGFPSSYRLWYCGNIFE